MDNTLYRALKETFLYEIKEIKRTTSKTDKARIRMEINDSLDRLMRDFERQALLTEKISQKQYDMYHLWLQNVSCNAHPK